MDLTNYPTVGYAGMTRIVRNAARVLRPTMVLGAPGVGKTARMGQLARELGLALQFFDLGNGAREDAMLPVQYSGADGRMAVTRVPLDQLAHACQAPTLLVIDEVTRCDKNKQAVAMALSNERRIGSWELHPQTVVVMLGNGLTSSGTYSLVDAFVNRCCVLVLRPERDEVRAVLAGLGPEGSTLRRLAEKWSAISGMRTELLAIEAPEGASESCAQWPSPRAIHHGVERMAGQIDSARETGEATNTEEYRAALLAELSGCVGREAAAAWFAVLAYEDKLPSEDEIMQGPTSAMLPVDFESSIAAMGLIKNVHSRNPNPAWIYLSRFGDKFPEAQACIARDIMRKPPTESKALEAFNVILGKIQRKRTALDR